MANLFFDYRPYPKLDKSDKVVGLEHFNRYVLTSYKDLQDENERYANALEWRFEFPEVLNDEGNFLGFDCIIGNPPYIDYRKIDEKLKSFYLNFLVYTKNQKREAFLYILLSVPHNSLLSMVKFLSSIQSLIFASQQIMELGIILIKIWKLQCLLICQI